MLESASFPDERFFEIVAWHATASLDQWLEVESEHQPAALLSPLLRKNNIENGRNETTEWNDPSRTDGNKERQTKPRMEKEKNKWLL